MLSKADPVGSVFAAAVGPVGPALFGLVFWTAGMTSTIGASFTSATFLKTLVPPAARRFNLSISVFIAISTVLYLIVGQTPAALLVFAGAFNGLILPFGLGIMLWIAWRRRACCRVRPIRAGSAGRRGGVAVHRLRRDPLAGGPAPDLQLIVSVAAVYAVIRWRWERRRYCSSVTAASSSRPAEICAASSTWVGT